MEKTKFEEMMDRLPSNIKETEVLRFQSKKVLAALLELYLHSSGAKETKLVIASNSLLRKISGVKSNDLLSSLNQLEDYSLITRKVGKSERGVASEYAIHFKNLIKPLKEKSFEELFMDEIGVSESLETPMGTPTTTTITTPITTTTSTPTSITNTTAITTAITTTTPIETSNEIETESHISEETLREFEVRKVLDPLRDEAFAILENSSIEDFKSFDQLESCVTRQLCSKAPTQEVENRLKRIISMKVRRMRHQWISAL